MRAKIITLTFFLIIGCGQTNQNQFTNDLNNFNAFLGKDKSKALDRLTESFDSFLQRNYPNIDNQSDRIRKFLEKILEANSPDSLWMFETKKNSDIIKTLELSGLRKEMWIYGYEDYIPKYDIHSIINNLGETSQRDTNQIITDFSILNSDEILSIEPEVDFGEMEQRNKELQDRYKNLLSSNIHGQFLYGIAKYAPNDTLIKEYLEIKMAVGDISLDIIISGILENIDNLNEPFIKRIIIYEVYYHFVNWDILRKNK